MLEITANMIHESLSKEFDLESFGGSDELLLKSALLYEDGMTLEDGHAYIVSGSSFPAKQPGSNGYLIACLEEPPQELANSGAPVLRALNHPSIARLFNSIQKTFQKYNDWADMLAKMLNNGASISQMLIYSAPIIGNPMAVVNDKLEILNAVFYSESSHEWVANDNGKMTLDHIIRMRKVFDYSVNMKEPFLHDDYGYERVYTINFFSQDRFFSNISMDEEYSQFTPSSFYLFRILARYIKRAIKAQINVTSAKFNPVKKAFKALLDGAYIEDSIISQALEEAAVAPKEPLEWICIALAPDDETSLSVPEYLIDSLGERLPGCTALQYSNTIALAAYLRADDDSRRLPENIAPLLQAAGFRAGVSDRFERLQDLRSAYFKAMRAVEMGVSSDSDKMIFHFQDYALAYMLKQAAGCFKTLELPPPGFMNLVCHDAESDISYLGTLRCYLANQMNGSKAAEELYLHRSSLIQRLEKIYSILGTRLETYDEQLYYGMLLKMIPKAIPQIKSK